MKTPREVLFGRHQAIGPKLDAVRRNALATLPPQGKAAPTRSDGRRGVLTQAMLQTWRELIWPSRRVWAAMAGLWLLVLGANLEMKDAPVFAREAGGLSPPEVERALAEQQRLLTELFAPTAPPSLEAPIPRPRPRSERSATFKTA